jgi:hypothetical protein
MSFVDVEESPTRMRLMLISAQRPIMWISLLCGVENHRQAPAPEARCRRPSRAPHNLALLGIVVARRITSAPMAEGGSARRVLRIVSVSSKSVSTSPARRTEVARSSTSDGPRRMQASPRSRKRPGRSNLWCSWLGARFVARSRLRPRPTTSVGKTMQRSLAACGACRHVTPVF